MECRQDYLWRFPFRRPTGGGSLIREDAWINMLLNRAHLDHGRPSFSICPEKLSPLGENDARRDFSSATTNYKLFSPEAASSDSSSATWVINGSICNPLNFRLVFVLFHYPLFQPQARMWRSWAHDWYLIRFYRIRFRLLREPERSFASARKLVSASSSMAVGMLMSSRLIKWWSAIISPRDSRICELDFSER